MKKRFLAFLLAVCVAVSMLVLPASAVGSNAAVQTATALGGLTAEQSASLGAPLTRGQAARLLTAFSAYRDTAAAQGRTGRLYSDVDSDSPYAVYIRTAVQNGWMTGYSDGSFRPNAPVTRAEFAAIAARFDNDGDKTAAKFSDIATHWAKDEISIAYNNGWITGYPDGTFGPQRDITRAETMTLVNRVLNRQPETEDDLLPNMTVWTDNANPKAWYYLAVQEATNSHYYEFKTNSQYEKWTELRETRDWTQLEK